MTVRRAVPRRDGRLIRQPVAAVALRAVFGAEEAEAATEGGALAVGQGVGGALGVREGTVNAVGEAAVIGVAAYLDVGGA